MAATRARNRRVLLIAVATLATIGGGAGAYAWRQSELDRLALAAGESGRKAALAGDFPAALDGLGTYLGRFGGRGVTSEDYRLTARARRSLELPNGKHLTSAILLLKKSLELDPGNAEARADLLDLYVESESTTETLDLLDTLLASKPGDLGYLRMKRRIFEQIRQFAKAMAVAKEINRLAPDDVDDHFATLSLFFRQDASARETDAWIDATIAAHPGDTRFELLRAAAFTRRHDSSHADPSLDLVLASDATSKHPGFAAHLVRELDEAGRFDDSLRVLERNDAASDAALLREQARRLWYAGRLKDLASSECLAKAPAASADPEVLALRSLALAATGRSGDAETLRRDLAALGGASAAGWLALADAFASAGRVNPGSVAALAKAAEAAPQSAILRAALGDAYAELGETDLAIEAWTTAAARAPAWAGPLRRAAEALMATGRVHFAPAIARAAARRAPRDAAALSVYVAALAASADEMDDDQIAALLGAVDALGADPQGRREDVPVVRLQILVRKDKAEAERALRAELASPAPAAESALLRMAEIAHRAGIPLEKELLDRAESSHGATPGVALAKARALARSAGPAAAIREFDGLRAKSAGTAAAASDWDVARANCLDVLHRPESGPAWIAIADARPGSLPAQLGALACGATWADREATGRIIGRLKDLTGDAGVTWRTARARWLLCRPSASVEEISEAATILGEVIRAAPKGVAARVLLAQAFERLRNLSGADEQLRIASELAPGNTWIGLEVARLAQRQGRAEDARRQLDRVLNAKDLAPEQVERAAFLLAAQGDQRRGAEILAPLADDPAADGPGLLLLAKLYAGLGEPARALALCERMLDAADPEVVALAADLYSLTGRPKDAERVLARLDAAGQRPGERELVRARHAATWGPAAAAVEWYRKAVAAAPERADAWDQYLAHAVATGDLAAMDAIAGDPAAASVGSVRFVAENRELCRAALPDQRLRALLLSALDEVPMRPVLLEAIRSVCAGWGAVERREEIAAAAKLLADSHTEALSLQLLAADLCAGTGDLRHASEIAVRAMRDFPNSSAAAHMAFDLLVRQARWPEALDAALQWRDRAGHRDRRPELAVAEALMRTGRAGDAATGLEPLVESALRDPDRNEQLLLAYATALVRCGRVPRATDLLGDLAHGSPRWRTLPLGVDPAVMGDGAKAAAWLKLCSDILPAEDRAGRAALARAWSAAWEAFRTPELLAGARAVLADLRAAPEVPADALFVAAVLEQADGDLAAAKRDYLGVLARDATRTDARNNLAMVLADLGDWEAAVAEATKAVSAAPGVADCLDTLAYAQRKGRKFGDAKASLARAIRLEPANPVWRISLAETLAESGGPAEELDRLLTSVDELVANGCSLSLPNRQRLDRLRAGGR